MQVTWKVGEGGEGVWGGDNTHYVYQGRVTVTSRRAWEEGVWQGVEGSKGYVTFSRDSNMKLYPHPFAVTHYSRNTFLSLPFKT